MRDAETKVEAKKAAKSAGSKAYWENMKRMIPISIKPHLPRTESTRSGRACRLVWITMMTVVIVVVVEQKQLLQ